MWSDLTPLELLADRLRKAATADPELFAAIADVSARVAMLRKAGKAGHLDQLIANGAWTDAALALLALELPAWKLRRLIHEDGDWICSLSRQPDLPLDLDDTADAHHSSLPLALLAALLEARAKTAANAPSVKNVPQVKTAAGNVQCCDNFS